MAAAVVAVGLMSFWPPTAQDAAVLSISSNPGCDRASQADAESNASVSNCLQQLEQVLRLQPRDGSCF